MCLIGFSEVAEIYIPIGSGPTCFEYMSFWGTWGSVLLEVNGLMLRNLVTSHSILCLEERG